MLEYIEHLRNDARRRYKQHEAYSDSDRETSLLERSTHVQTKSGTRPSS